MEGFTIDLEGKAGEDILGIRNNMHTEVEWHKTTRHAWGMANCPLCQAHQMDRMESGICEGLRGKPELGCGWFPMGFRIIQNYFKGKSFIANFQIMSHSRYS